MVFYALTFYGFATLMILSSVMVVFSPNSVHSVLFLVFAFLNSAGVYILLGAEFIALSTVIVYIGAVAVLFLFIVMTMETKDRASNSASSLSSLKKYKIILSIAGGVFLAELVGMAYMWKSKIGVKFLLGIESVAENTKVIGGVIYTKYAYVFQASAIILLVSMVGAIILIFRDSVKKNVRRQNASAQINRDPKEVVKMVSKKIGEGI